MPAFKSPLSSSPINVQKEGLLVELFQKSFWNKERFFIGEQKKFIQAIAKKVKNLVVSISVFFSIPSSFLNRGNY